MAEATVRPMRRHATKSPAENVVHARRPHATIKDIANALAVSHSTVSRALNDHPQISSGMKSRVRQTASELGYVVNAGARTLRQSSSRLIGIVVPEVTNQLSSLMIETMAKTCEESDYQLVLCVTGDDPRAELRNVQLLRQGRALGIVLVPTPNVLPETVDLIRAMAAVQFSRSDSGLSCPSVGVDGGGGIANAVRHLADLGHRRIAFIGLPMHLSTGANRADGFYRAMAQRSLTVEERLFITGPGTIEYARAMTMSLVKQSNPPTAIVFASPTLTQGGLEALRSASLTVPRDLSIIGFGDPGWFKLMTPSLSTVGLPFAESTQAAMHMLMRQIEAREAGRTIEQTSIELETDLILRASTAPPKRDQ